MVIPSAYTKAFNFVMKAEGGKVNHPNDPGRATAYGVTQETYDYYRTNKRLGARHVFEITPSELAQIYLSYWVEGKCDKMPPSLGIVHFDTCVNFGIGGAGKMLQKLIPGLVVDGIVGNNTLKAIELQNTAILCRRYIHARKQFRHQRVKDNPSQKVFLEGWLNRDNHLAGEIGLVDVK